MLVEPDATAGSPGPVAGPECGVADPAPRRPGLAGPLLAAGGVVAAAAYTRAVDPARGGVFPACPFHRLTGWWCPGCGLTRGFHHLLTGDVPGALGSNLFLPVVVVLAGWLWLSWLWPAVTGRRLAGPARVPNQVWVALVSLALVYAVLRNLPFAPFAALAP